MLSVIIMACIASFQTGAIYPDLKELYQPKLCNKSITAYNRLLINDNVYNAVVMTQPVPRVRWFT